MFVKSNAFQCMECRWHLHGRNLYVQCIIYTFACHPCFFFFFLSKSSQFHKFSFLFEVSHFLCYYLIAFSCGKVALISLSLNLRLYLLKVSCNVFLTHILKLQFISFIEWFNYFVASIKLKQFFFLVAIYTCHIGRKNSGSIWKLHSGNSTVWGYSLRV